MFHEVSTRHELFNAFDAFVGLVACMWFFYTFEMWKILKMYIYIQTNEKCKNIVLKFRISFSWPCEDTVWRYDCCEALSLVGRIRQPADTFAFIPLLWSVLKNSSAVYYRYGYPEQNKKNLLFCKRGEKKNEKKLFDLSDHISHLNLRI